MVDLTAVRHGYDPLDEQIRFIKTHYQIDDEDQVLAFLRAIPELSNLLIEGYAQLETLFGDPLQVELEVATDPEIADSLLLASVWTALSVPEAMSKRDEFNHQWFFHEMDRAQGLLVFDLRFHGI